MAPLVDVLVALVVERLESMRLRSGFPGRTMRRPSLSNFGGSGRVEARDLRRMILGFRVDGAVRRAVAACGSCGERVVSRVF